MQLRFLPNLTFESMTILRKYLVMEVPVDNFVKYLI